MCIYTCWLDCNYDLQSQWGFIQPPSRRSIGYFSGGAPEMVTPGNDENIGPFRDVSHQCRRKRPFGGLW